MTKYLSDLKTVAHEQSLPIVCKDYVVTTHSDHYLLCIFLIFTRNPLFFPIIFRLFPITQLVVWKIGAGLQMCLKQALHARKQLLWRSFTKDFHENDKVEVKLRCFEVEVFYPKTFCTCIHLV